MSTNRTVLTDELLRQALIELAAGPDAGGVTASVMRSVEATPQRGGLVWPLIDLSRRTTLILVAGLLLAGLVATVAVYSGVLPRPVPLPVVPSTVVTQLSNGLRGEEFAAFHTAFPSGSVTGTVLSGDLPANAVGLRWSPDGSRLAYSTVEWPLAGDVPIYTGAFVANADGSDPTPLELGHDMSMYMSSGWWNGADWAPSGERLAVEWVRTVCAGANCPGGSGDVYEHGFEIFDAAGSLIVAWDAGAWSASRPIWSPDSTAVGWTGYPIEDCEFYCEAFHWRTLTDDTVTSIALEEEAVAIVTWSTDNRLRVVQHGFSGNPDRMISVAEYVYSMTPNGTNRQDGAWTRAQVPFWSPDGRMLAAVDPVAGQLIVLDLGTGDETIVSIPTGMKFVEWGPEGDRVILVGDPGCPDCGQDINAGPEDSQLYLVTLDGSDPLPLGRADDFGWMPASVSEGEIPD
jgi:Tol biopolymer transport system component